jgi:hypothetical protein
LNWLATSLDGDVEILLFFLNPYCFSSCHLRGADGSARAEAKIKNRIAWIGIGFD